MVQLWKMLVSEQPVRKRYLQKQGSILSRGRRAVSAVAPPGGNAKDRTVQLPPIAPVERAYHPPQGKERLGTWRALPKRAIDPLPHTSEFSRHSRCSVDSSCTEASSPAPAGSPIPQLPI